MRSTYIYLIFEHGKGPYAEAGSNILSVHTVKHEAHTWLKRSTWTPETATLWRALDGVSGLPVGKAFTKMKWEPKLLGLDESLDSHLTRCSSEVEDWPKWGKCL